MTLATHPRQSARSIGMEPADIGRPPAARPARRASRGARARTAAVLRWGLVALSLFLLLRLARAGWPDIRGAVALLAARRTPLVAAAVGLEIAWVVSMAQVYRASLRALGGELGNRAAMRISMGAFTLSRILPGGGAAGSVFAAREIVALGNPAP